MTLNYVSYSDSVEQPEPGEQETFDQIAAMMADIGKKVGDRQRHVVRSVHAKSHGLLKAELTVVDGLPPELRQGLFAATGHFDTIMRFSTNPGDILSDHISSPRGLAIKILGVDGEMLPSHQGHTTQDIIFNNSKVFAAPNAEGFLKSLKTLDKHANDPEALKQVVSSTAQVAEEALELVGGKSATLLGFGHPPTNPLGESYYTNVPVRYGGYFGKMAIVPVSQNLVDLIGKHVEHPQEWNILRDTIVDFFKTQSARWELRVQLCTDLEKMPVEDGSVEWDEKLSPYITVAELTAGAQDAYSDERRVFVDEKLSFNPFHALAAHRPLGNIMRARFKSYQVSSQYRHKADGREMIEPTSISELPA